MSYNQGKLNGKYKHGMTGTPIYKAMSDAQVEMIANLSESRVCSISKDDLRMDEKQLTWDDQLEAEVLGYWEALNKWWVSYKERGELPNCTCADHENGFLAREAYNPYFKDGEPCSLKYFKEWQKEKSNA